MNKHILISYDTQKLSIALIDNFELCKNDCCQFYTVNIQDYDMILKLSWLKKINLNIQWFDPLWIYCENRVTQIKQLNIRIMNNENFIQRVMLARKNNNETYIVLSY